MSVPGVNVMLLPVGNSPGPDSTVSVTGTALATCLPEASATFTVTCTSSVPSAGLMAFLSADSFTCAGVPFTGHSGGGMFLNLFLYQYQARLGMRK